MVPFLARRVLYMVLFLLALSLVGFLIIELPPGNYLDVHIARLRNTGVRIDQAEIDRLMRLYEAQNVQTVALHPWLLIPGVFVIVGVLAFNFVGDGLRDAADPYK